MLLVRSSRGGGASSVELTSIVVVRMITIVAILIGLLEAIWLALASSEHQEKEHHAEYEPLKQGFGS